MALKNNGSTNSITYYFFLFNDSITLCACSIYISFAFSNPINFNIPGPYLNIFSTFDNDIAFSINSFAFNKSLYVDHLSYIIAYEYLNKYYEFSFYIYPASSNIFLAKSKCDIFI